MGEYRIHKMYIIITLTFVYSCELFTLTQKNYISRDEQLKLV